MSPCSDTIILTAPLGSGKTTVAQTLCRQLGLRLTVDEWHPGQYVCAGALHLTNVPLSEILAAASQEAKQPLTPSQLRILRHSLGLREDGCGYSFRNHYVTGEGSVDWPKCMALVESGLMRRHKGSPLSGGGDIFVVTEAGKRYARVFGEVS